MCEVSGIIKDYLDYAVQLQENTRILLIQEHIPDDTQKIEETLEKFSLEISNKFPNQEKNQKLNKVMKFLSVSSTRIQESLLQAKRRLHETRSETTQYIGNMMSFFIEVVEIRSHIKATGAFILVLNSALVEISKPELTKHPRSNSFPSGFLSLFKTFIENDYYPTSEEKDYYAQKFGLGRIQIDTWLWNNRSRARKRKIKASPPLDIGSSSENESLVSTSKEVGIINQRAKMIMDNFDMNYSPIGSNSENFYLFLDDGGILMNSLIPEVSDYSFIGYVTRN
jgi:hypothetical protein